MSAFVKPNSRPINPNFASGPCSKRPGWSLAALEKAMLGRSHRAAAPKARIVEVIERSKALLGMPQDWVLAVVPGSDTGAVETALWSLLGPRPVDVLSFETFSTTWAVDIAQHLKLRDVQTLEAPFGELPDVSKLNGAHDIVLAWNGTTSGVRMPGADALPDNREGLVICDATSAVFAMALPWDKLDVVTWSWQKALGGEAAHGMLVLSPRAVQRLESYTPAWPLPKVFRLTSGGKLNAALFRGDTLNTPSMLCVEDALDGLAWAERIGGLDALIARSEANLAAVSAWEAKSEWAEFLCRNPACRSNTSICLRMVAPWFQALDRETQFQISRKMAGLLDAEGVAHDIASYISAPPGLRIWGGATIDASDMELLMPWLDWAYSQIVP
jgi:phosphoserine aminotransferase